MAPVVIPPKHTRLANERAEGGRISGGGDGKVDVLSHVMCDAVC